LNAKNNNASLSLIVLSSEELIHRMLETLNF